MDGELSDFDRFRTLPDEERGRRLALLSDGEALALAYDWDFHSRPKQKTPSGDWQNWLIMAGRGFGKTRVGAEWVRRQVRDYRYVNIIGATADDARDIMIEGESGILAVCPPYERPEYIKNASKLIWPNGAQTLVFTADVPDRLRGKQHEKLWADEVCSWRYTDAWDQAQFGLRLGPNPQSLVTTTPRANKIILGLIDSPDTVVTCGATDENKNNLSPKFFNRILSVYSGTRLEKQERFGNLLRAREGALWTLEMISENRVSETPLLRRIVVAIDPAVTSGKNSDETGIIIAGVGYDGHGYILKDATLKASPLGWASVAVSEYLCAEADCILGEVNNGGDLVEMNIRSVDENVAYKAVRASRGKYARAEPVAALYEQGKIHHVGVLPELEEELIERSVPDPKISPNRMDALVWAIFDLILDTDDFRVF